MPEATLMRGFESRALEVASGSIRYFVGGAGPPVVLVHGLGGAATNWTEVAPLLARRRRVLVPDLPGHGRSDPLPAGHGLSAFADRVARLAEHEGMLPAAVVGHSLGGVVGLRLAVHRPYAVSALALVAAAAIVSATRRAEISLRLVTLVRPGKRIAPFRHHIARRPNLRRLVFGYWGADDPTALSPEAVLGFLEGPAYATDIATAARALVTDDPRQDLDRVRCPSLVLWGARDRQVPPADGFEYARRLRAPIRMLAGAGHLLIGERPVECAAILEEFLDRVGEVDELPLDAELLSQLGGKSTDA